MSLLVVIILGALFGLIGDLVIYVYAKTTAAFRASHRKIGPIMTPVFVFGLLILLITLYGRVARVFGPISHPVSVAGFLAFAVVWAIGAVYVAVKFATKKP